MLEALRSADGETGEAASAYLDLVGYRLLDGFDISGRYALELPDALLRAVRVAVEEGAPADADIDARIVEVRDRIPEEHRAQFDELLEEARVTYRIRDERGVFSDIWASGIMRRAVLAAGRRLAAKGRVHDPEHLVDAGFDEMRALIADGTGPSADELGAATCRADVPHREGRPALPRDPPRRRPTRPGCRRGARRVMRGAGARARRDVRQLRGRARRAGGARAVRQPGRVRGHRPAGRRPGRVRPHRAAATCW